MVTDAEAEYTHILTALEADDWTSVLTAIDAAAACFLQLLPGGAAATRISRTLAALSTHDKWEIRRAIAQVAGQIHSPLFESTLVRLAADDNARVRQAAQQAALRRRDWRNASALGRQHEQRINATLEDIEARFGVRGREAVKRASEQIANAFVRELYHEVIKLISPLVTAADRLRVESLGGAGDPLVLSQQADRIGRQVAHLRAVLDAMRAYAAAPLLEFAPEPLHEVIEEAANVARAWKPDATQAEIQVDMPSSFAADVARPRLVQAFTNLLINAIESYEGLTHPREPIRVRAKQGDGIATVSIKDAGCGMSPEVLQDAPLLFSTSKHGGTGVGLPLAIKIIESEHGGRVSIESRKGVGTVVTVSLPSHRAAGA